MIQHRMIGADAIQVMHREHNWDVMLLRHVHNRSRQHTVKQIDMNDIRLFVPEQFVKLAFSF